MKKTLLRKETTLITLPLTSALIGTAIAAVYYMLTMQPIVTINGAPVRFVLGSDAPTGSSLGTNATYAKLALKAYPNATLIYDQPLNVSNTDGSGHQFRLRHVSITPASGSASVGNFTFINFVVKDKTGVYQASMNYTTSGNSWSITPSETSYMSLPASTQWIIYIETKAKAGAWNNIAANIQIAIDVQ